MASHPNMHSSQNIAIDGSLIFADTWEEVEYWGALGLRDKISKAVVEACAWIALHLIWAGVT